MYAIQGSKDNVISSDILPPLPYRIDSVTDAKEFNRIIKCATSLVRRCYEYKLWIDYVKKTLGYNKCALTGEVTDDVTIEIHHHPICLSEICEIVLENKLSKDESFSTLDIANEVMELHYKNIVGYIPLCSTLHEKYHNSKLLIPINLVHGEWKELFSIYKIPDSIVVKVSKLASIGETNHKGWEKDSYIGITNERIN